ncbi:hypothetical protein [Clostridium estertheticum]|uniref:hypothetical protein n=1 Tax=Clostridium estertheticum TaxID=238834 RepID=UPI001C0E5DB6|nr:hypothetical protein [Clostridium estertheticum]MBU3173322.1 hypothetical protein [Clostridium estertheticum]
MTNTKYVIRQFTVCKRSDSNDLVNNCKTFVAEMYNNFDCKVDGILYSNDEFNKIFTINTL